MENGTYLSLDGKLIKVNATTGYWVAVHQFDTLDDVVTGDYVGVWTDPETGIEYLDRSVWVADASDAIALGNYSGQLAIWDNANQTELWLAKH